MGIGLTKVDKGIRHIDLRKSAIIENILLPGGVMQITGCSKAGKSWLLVEMALRIANGADVFGYKVLKPQRVAYYNGELSRDEFDVRVNEVGRHLKLESDDVVGIHRMEGDKWPDVMDGVAELVDAGIGVLIVDPISSTYAGKVSDENSNSDIYEHLNDMRELFSRHGITLIYAHHHNKGGSGGDTVNAGSGAGAFGRVGTAFVDIEDVTVGTQIRFKSRSFKQLATISVKPVDIIDEWGEPCAQTFEWSPVKTKEDRIRDDILSYVAKNDGTKKTLIATEVKGDKQTVLKVIDEMLDAEMLAAVPMPGRGNPIAISLPEAVSA